MSLDGDMFGKPIAGHLASLTVNCFASLRGCSGGCAYDESGIIWWHDHDGKIPGRKSHIWYDVCFYAISGSLGEVWVHVPHVY